MPTAVIHIGTNTLLLLIVDEAMQPIVDLCRFGRLGKGLDATERLAEDAITASLAICREYRQVLDDHGVARPIVLATQATREARNAADFVVTPRDSRSVSRSQPRDAVGHARGCFG